jgi:cytochrome-b5 reductase
LGNGNFRVRNKKTEVISEKHFRKLVMIAGGSGITPLFQVINQVLKTEEDTTEIWLLFANQTPQDVLMK